MRYSVPLINRLPWLPLGLMNLFPLSLTANACLYVGKRIDAWEYPAKSTRRRADNESGYERSEGYLAPGDRAVRPEALGSGAVEGRATR